METSITVFAGTFRYHFHNFYGFIVKKIINYHKSEKHKKTEIIVICYNLMYLDMMQRLKNGV